MKTDTAKIMLNTVAERMALCVRVAAECGMTPEEAEAFLMEGFRVHGNTVRDMTIAEVQKRVEELINEDKADGEEDC